MERLEAKRVKGHTYYYYSKWTRADNRCRRVWQKYLGKLEDIVAAVQGGGPAPISAEVFQWGLPQALWQEATRAQLVDLIDRHCPKHRQGLTTGQYLAIAALNRAISPSSKLKRLLSGLDGIREVINFYPKQQKSARQPQQTVLTHLSEVQQRLVSIPGLEREKHHELG